MASPLVDLRMFRNPALRASLATSAMVSTVMMATLVVGPFYLSRALGLTAAAVGMAMSGGTAYGYAGGHSVRRTLVDRFGPVRTTVAGLSAAMPVGCLALWMIPASAGVFGYIGGIVVITAGYALFQAANNTAAMAEIGPDQRGVVSGMLNLFEEPGVGDGRLPQWLPYSRWLRPHPIRLRRHPEAIVRRNADYLSGRGVDRGGGALGRDRRARSNQRPARLGRSVWA